MAEEHCPGTKRYYSLEVKLRVTQSLLKKPRDLPRKRHRRFIGSPAVETKRAWICLMKSEQAYE